MTTHTLFASLGFPLWLRLTHFVNLLFIGLLIRSGIQILATHPRLYWNDSSDPKRQWLKFTTTKVWYSLRKKRQMQTALRIFSDPVVRLILQKRKSKQHYEQSDISPISG